MMNSAAPAKIIPDPRPAFSGRAKQFGLTFNLGFSLAVGLLLTFIFHNLWWLAWSSFAGLCFAGIVSVALLGADNLPRSLIITLLYFATIGLIYLMGHVAEVWLPPWPSLPHHATTYFFLGPPAMILAGTLRLFVSDFHKDERLIWLRLTPILTALSVIFLFTFRPALP